jgi:predicted kinase
MPRSDATLHMLCGKIAAGKSTLSAKLAQAEKTLVISEDRWIEQLYRPELKTLADYFERCERLRATLAPHVVGLLRAGVSVVLDFHANTLRSRRWIRALFEEAGRPTNSISSTCPTRCAGRACTRARLREATASATPSSIMSPVSSFRPSQAKRSA